MTAPATREYPLSRALRARLSGAFLAATGALVLVVTVVSLLVRPPGPVLVGIGVLLALELAAVAVLLGGRWYVVRLDEIGYKVRLVRGVGRASGRWIDVEDLTTAYASGTEVVVLRLRDGSSSTLPVNVIEGDREEFVDELRRRLDAGHGYRRP